jgi:hypothetical protein
MVACRRRCGIIARATGERQRFAAARDARQRDLRPGRAAAPCRTGGGISVCLHRLDMVEQHAGEIVQRPVVAEAAR